MSEVRKQRRTICDVASKVFIGVDLKKVALAFLQKEIDGAVSLQDIISENFVNIACLIAGCNGRVIICGIGKSGYIGQKISSTMSSVGIHSFFLNPNDASHGDLGMIKKEDIAIMISNSGETKEFFHLISFIKMENITSVAITRAEFSTIASASTYKIVMPPYPELSSYGAPTTSTTQTLIIGDILAAVASEIKNFKDEDYAKIHPGGKLGLSLIKVRDCMRKRSEILVCQANQKLSIILPQMKSGFCVIEDSESKLLSVMTDGDLRRAILKYGNILNLTAEEIANKAPKSLFEEQTLINALEIFNQSTIGTIVVTDKKGSVVGSIDRKDIEF